MRSNLFVLGVAFALGACGGGNTGYAPASSPMSRGEQPMARNSAPSGEATPYPISPSAGDAPQGAQSSTPYPSERRGLGTEWGEGRYSRTFETQFERASQSPLSVLSLNYDDRRGVDRFIGYRSDARQTANYAIRGGWLSVSITHPNGQLYDAIESGGRLIVIGQSGDAYQIVIRNHSPRRVEAVATVDGIDVINGKDGELSNRGYIVDAYGTAQIDGFRKSEREVATFRFGAVHDSYAVRTGRGRDVGVIGVAFFAERGSSWNDQYLRDSANPFPADSRFAPPP